MRNVKEMIEVTGGELLSGGVNRVFGRVITESEKTEPGDCFAAIKGKRTDGNDHVPEAIRRGCGVILTEKDLKAENVSVIKTKSVTEALSALAAYYREKELEKVIAVTGSFGKTTVKDLTALILSEETKVRKTEGNRNNLLGLPFSVLGGHEEKTGVFELGISENGEMEKLADIARPDIAVITGIGKTHLEYFGTEENTAREKLKIADKMKKDGTLLLDYDSTVLKNAVKAGNYDGVPLFVSLSDKKADFYADGTELRDGFSLFDFYFAGKKVMSGLKVPITGAHGVKDALFAAACGFLSGSPYDAIRSGLKKYSFRSPYRSIIGTGNYTVFSDCYNAGPEAFGAALNALETVKESRKCKSVCVIAGSMLELGTASESEHLRLGVKIAGTRPAYLITVGKEAGKIAEGAISAGLEPEKVFSFGDAGRAEEQEEIEELLGDLKEKADLFFIKGSRRLALERFSEYLTGK